MASFPETLWAQARKAHGEGRFEDSLTLCRSILEEHPRDLNARLMAGISAARLGKTATAVEFLTSIVLDDPQAFPAHMWLSLVLSQAGQLDDALTHASRAVQIEPRHPEVQHALGTVLLARGDAAGARAALERSVAVEPANPAYQYGLSVSLERLGMIPEAIRALRRATKALPHPDWLYHLGLLEADSGETVRARVTAERLQSANPDSVEAHQLLARVLQEEGREQEAEEHVRRALDIEPDRDSLHLQLGLRHQLAGRFDEAVVSFLRSIEIEPVQGSAYYGLTGSRRVGTEDEPLVAQMEEVAASGRLDDSEQRLIEYALGKAYHELGQPEQAMAHFDRANELTLRTGFGGRQFDRQAFRRDVDDEIRVFSREFIESQAPGSDSERPVFVVGMIRSGTTLMEHILSCHPEVGAGGEQEFWAVRERRIVDFIRGSIDPSALRSGCREYLEILERLAPGKARVTDKNPANVLNLGLIHVAFPNAKIVHMRRHPVDTFLSIWMTAIRNPPPFACDKENIVFAYREYLRAIEHWRKVLPPSVFLEVEYEALVGGQEEETRRVLDFVGLEWNDACARPQDNPREVRTPSLWQVRQPIHRGSVEKWKVYEPWLGPFAEFVDSDGS